MEASYEDDLLTAYIRDRYCVCDSRGSITEEKIQKVRAVLERGKIDPANFREQPPKVPGVPARVDHLETAAQIPDLIRKYYPVIARDQSLLHLSFINPLQLATDILGISVTPAMSAFIRAKLRNVMSFQEVPLPFDGEITGIKNIKWNLDKIITNKN